MTGIIHEGQGESKGKSRAPYVYNNIKAADLSGGMERTLDRSKKRLAELEKILQKDLAPQAQIDVLCETAWELRMNDPERSFAISERTLRLSSSGEFASQTYAPGMAHSLANMAFIETYQGHFDTAASRCMRAIALLDPENPTGATVDAYYVLSWNSLFLGDHPAALEHGQNGLKLARELGLKVHEAWALDALASINGSAGDFKTALDIHRTSLFLFDALDDLDGKLRALNNLAYTHYLLKDYPNALHESLRSLKLAEQTESEYQYFNLCCTTAQILIDMQRWDEAEEYLNTSLSGLERLDPKNVTRVFGLMERGRMCLIKENLSEAEIYFMNALVLAEQTDRRSEQALCRQRLSEIYELRQEYDKALKQYKSFHAINESVTGERNAQRLAVLNAVYQVESAQHEKEIYRLKTISLQSEMEKQKEAQEVLETLSRLDGLTGIYNRRYFDERLEEEYARHTRSKTELSLILLDVDHFKAYNDTYGHVQGDECLKVVARAIKQIASRALDIAARYGGEEFACILPDTNVNGALAIAEEMRLKIIDLAIPHSASKTADVVTISLGVVTTCCKNDKSVIELIAHADEQLYKAKSAGRNCVRSIAISTLPPRLS